MGPWSVDIVFAGHNHYYARASVEGVQHITTGGGGAPLYAPDPNFDRVVTSAESYHFCEVEIQGNNLYVTARDESGVILDYLNITKPDSSEDFPWHLFLPAITGAGIK